MNKWLLCLLCCLWIGQLQAQKQLVVTQQEAPTAFYPESGKACVELISPLEDLNIVSTFGETCTRELNEDELWVYRFVFDLADESKRTLYISAPGFVREELKLAGVVQQAETLFHGFPPGKQTAVLPRHAHRVCLFRNGDGRRKAGFWQTGGRLCRLQDFPLEKGRCGNRRCDRFL